MQCPSILQNISILIIALLALIAIITILILSIHTSNNLKHKILDEDINVDVLDIYNSTNNTISFHQNHTKYNTKNKSSSFNHSIINNDIQRIYNIYKKRLKSLKQYADKSILIHMHIPKAAGTAASIALTSNCHCSNGHCRDCKQVYVNKYHRPYSMSRETGWECGVHAPLSILRSCETIQLLSKHGFQPVYIIFLRSPFQRFISETFFWSKYRTPDWAYNKKKPYGHGIDLLKGYLALPQEMMIHNRQIKMIGVGKRDFNMVIYSNYDDKYGTRYQGNTDTKTRRDILKHASNYLSYESKELFIFGLEERFEDSLFILKTIYGNLYKFNWDPKKNSHSEKKDLNYATSTSTEYMEYMNNKVLYKKWLENNREDEIFYNRAIKLFDIQYQIALDMSRNKNI